MNAILAMLVSASLISFELQNLKTEGTRNSAIIKFENRSDQPLSLVLFDCSFFDTADAFIDLTKTNIAAIGPKQTVYGKVYLNTDVSVGNVSCRITSIF